MKQKKLSNLFFYYIMFIYLELVFRIFCTEKVLPFTFLNTLIYLIPVSLIFSIITSCFKEKVNYILSKIIIFTTTFLYGVCLVFKLKFGVFFSINSMGLADQLNSFLGDTFKTIGSNIIQIILLFIPFILSFVLKKYIQ